LKTTRKKDVLAIMAIRPGILHPDVDDTCLDSNHDTSINYHNDDDDDASIQYHGKGSYYYDNSLVVVGTGIRCGL
jgi:hypothetical protein